MLEQAAQELFMGENHFATLAVMGVVLPSEGDGILVYQQESVIGDGYTVGVACQVLQDVFRSPKGRFGVDHPILAKESAQERSECFLVRQRLALPVEAELIKPEGSSQAGDELTSKDTAEHSHRQEEVSWRRDPPCVIRR
jgi:hypothetical protein